MKFLFFALLSFIAPTLVGAQETDAARAISFHISSFNSPFAMQGDFEGELRILSDSIEVSLTKADVCLIENPIYKGSRNFVYLKFDLATTTDGGKWKIIERSKEFSVNKIMNPGDDYSIKTAFFSIPKDEATDLSKYWIVVEIGDSLLYPIDDEPVEGFAYAHSFRDIFTRKETTVKF
ncbi:MAG: hypothetical protein ACR2HG_03520 [Pyrinomonadaceae bacterium]